MTKKSKIIMIVAIAAAVVLIATGITVALVLSNDYLDSLKKYDVASNRSYDGVEILEKDGLFYLTRDGKKLSDTGYTYLKSVNDSYFANLDEDYGDMQIAKYEDVEFYDWYIARKPDANTYFMVSAEGEEYTIAGENVEYVSTSLPFVFFKDTVTKEEAALSVKNLDSALSTVSGNEITLNMYDEVEPEKAQNKNTIQADYVYVRKIDPVTGNFYSYINAEGSAICHSPSTRASVYNVYDEDAEKDVRFLLTSLGELYNLKGEVVVKDVVGEIGYGWSDITGNVNYIKVTSEPFDENLTTEDNAKNKYVTYVSAKAATKLDLATYDIDGILDESWYGNLFWVTKKNTDGTLSEDKQLINVITGESVICRKGVGRQGGMVMFANDDATLYTYVDPETGATLMQSKYNDMVRLPLAGDKEIYATGVYYSVAELAEKNANITEKAPAAYLHFVAAGKTEVVYTLAYNEGITNYNYNYGAPVAIITSTEEIAATETTEAGSIIKHFAYMPFATGTAKTGAYDKLQYLDMFGDGVGVLLGTDYEGGKYDFIDAATGTIVKTVNAAGAEMAKTTFNYKFTEYIITDLFNDESAVEFAVIEMVKKDDNGVQASTQTLVFSRNTPMTDDDTLATKPVSVTELGENLYSVEFVNNYLIVNTTPRSGVVYTVNDSYALEKGEDMPYRVLGAMCNSLDYDFGKYVVTVLDEDDNRGLYSYDGTQILAPVYDMIMPCDSEYFIVTDKGGSALFKYNAEKGKMKQLTDFTFDAIHYLSDGGFVADEDGESYLYHENDRVKSDRIIGDRWRTITNYWIDEETGDIMYTYNYVMNFDGKLYIHRTELGVPMIYADPYCADKDEWFDIQSSDVTVINMRNADGSLIETKVVYPTFKSKLDFTLGSDVWYYSPIEDLQETPVVEAEVEAKGGIVNIYKAIVKDPGLAG